jgi:hypothetical protein
VCPPVIGYRPQVPVADSDVAADLARAGLQFVESVRGGVRLPLPPNRSGASCLPEHGRFDAAPYEIVGVDDPDLPGKVNAGWWRMATEYGLFDEPREFLLRLGLEDPNAEEFVTVWARVRLLDEWDLGGGGASLLRSTFAGLFTDRYVPEFVMTAVDGRMVLETTVWGDGTLSTLVVRPDRLTDMPQ